MFPFLISLLFAAFGVAEPRQSDDALSLVRRLVFSSPLAHFITAADRGERDPRLDWTSDGCSAPLVGGTGRSFDFTNACRRHDFGYRNFSRIDGGIWWDAPTRRRVDDKFLADMRSSCSRRPTRDRLICRGWALVFYRTVRAYAGP
jgi:hypothetical protein